MDAAGINAKIYKGRGLAARRIGFPCDIFRPSGAEEPLSWKVGTIPVAFNAADNAYLKPNQYGKPVWYGDFDGRFTQVGDYLVRQSDGAVWFVAAQQPLLPIICVDCPRKVYIQRQPDATATEGVGSYSALTDPANVLGSPDYLWPASILMGGRKEASTGLPGGVPEAAWSILLPPSAPLTVQQTDIITDDNGRKFAVQSAEESDLGWRLLATEVHS